MRLLQALRGLCIERWALSSGPFRPVWWRVDEQCGQSLFCVVDSEHAGAAIRLGRAHTEIFDKPIDRARTLIKYRFEVFIPCSVDNVEQLRRASVPRGSSR